MDYVGLHHFGICVEAVDGWAEKLKALGADSVSGPPAPAAKTGAKAG